MGGLSTVYIGHPVDERKIGGEAIISERVFPVPEGGQVSLQGYIPLCDIQVEAAFNREEGQDDAWVVRVPGEKNETEDEFELPMLPWNLSDLDGFEGQIRYRELAETIEERIGRTGLTILVH